jgi:cysteine desulfuration protein SufE
VTAGLGTLNPRLQEIAEDFGAVPDRERLQLLLEFSEELPPLPARYAEHQDLLEQVPECQSLLFLAVEVDDDGIVHLFFDAPREAPTTRGFAGILHAGLDGLGADEVLRTPAEFSSQLGLQDLVSPLRLRGIAAMLARIKRQVREQRD